MPNSLLYQLSESRNSCLVNFRITGFTLRRINADTHISLAHGNGGRYMRELIERVFSRHLNESSLGEPLDTEVDSVLLKDISGPIYTTVDGFAVLPIEFPGGNIGSLAVHGTVSDLAVAGAIPRYLTLSAFLEEGLPIDVLERTVASMAKAAREVHVRIVAGDTKVLPRGHGDVLLITPLGGERRLEELEDDPLPRI
jgi:hydrogenase expression/formation protein HypE